MIYLLTIYSINWDNLLFDIIQYVIFRIFYRNTDIKFIEIGVFCKFVITP